MALKQVAVRQRSSMDVPLRFSFGAWRRLVAHSLGVRVVVGSNPAAPIFFPPYPHRGPVAYVKVCLGRLPVLTFFCADPAE